MESVQGAEHVCQSLLLILNMSCWPTRTLEGEFKIVFINIREANIGSNIRHLFNVFIGIVVTAIGFGCGDISNRHFITQEAVWHMVWVKLPLGNTRGIIF
jgi:hypothetical protein